jgi:hypothetical protein
LRHWLKRALEKQSGVLSLGIAWNRFKRMNNTHARLFWKPDGAGGKRMGSSLRQHYLDQVQRVFCDPAQNSQPLAALTGAAPVGSPVNLSAD